MSVSVACAWQLSGKGNCGPAGPLLEICRDVRGSALTLQYRHPVDPEYKRGLAPRSRPQEPAQVSYISTARLHLMRARSSERGYFVLASGRHLPANLRLTMGSFNHGRTPSLRLRRFRPYLTRIGRTNHDIVQRSGTSTDEA